jgi:hypothetical protein
MRVMAFEARRAEELARLLGRQGASVTSASALRETSLPDSPAARELVAGLDRDEVGAVMLLTGVGTRALAAVVGDTAPRLLAAFGHVPVERVLGLAAYHLPALHHVSSARGDLLRRMRPVGSQTPPRTPVGPRRNSPAIAIGSSPCAAARPPSKGSLAPPRFSCVRPSVVCHHAPRIPLRWERPTPPSRICERAPKVAWAISRQFLGIS